MMRNTRNARENLILWHFNTTDYTVLIDGPTNSLRVDLPSARSQSVMGRVIKYN